MRRLHTRVDVRMHAHTYARMHACSYAYSVVPLVHVRMCIDVCMHTCMHKQKKHTASNHHPRQASGDRPMPPAYPFIRTSRSTVTSSRALGPQCYNPCPCPRPCPYHRPPRVLLAQTVYMWWEATAVSSVSCDSSSSSTSPISKPRGALGIFGSWLAKNAPIRDPATPHTTTSNSISN